MRVLVLVRPRHFVPRDQFPSLMHGFADWRARHRERMEVFEFFAGGGGGVAIVNVPDEATLQQLIIEYPFTPFSEFEVRPILDGDIALQQWQAALQATGGG